MQTTLGCLFRMIKNKIYHPRNSPSYLLSNVFVMCRFSRLHEQQMGEKKETENAKNKKRSCSFKHESSAPVLRAPLPVSTLDRTLKVVRAKNSTPPTPHQSTGRLDHPASPLQR